MRVYNTDNGTKIKLDTGEDLSSAEKVEIHAIDPSGKWVTLVAEDVESTKVQHTKTATTLVDLGDWRLHSYVEFPGEEGYTGEPYELRIWKSPKSLGP